MKLKTLIIIFLCVATHITSTFGQNRILSDSVINNSTVHKIRFTDTLNCEGIEKWIKTDISNQTIFLFLDSGIAPKVYDGDKSFENKYGVYYHDFGDTPPDSKCLVKYDDYVFDYLTKNYGTKWMKEIRKDVIGYKEWKQDKRSRR